LSPSWQANVSPMAAWLKCEIRPQAEKTMLPTWFLWMAHQAPHLLSWSKLASTLILSQSYSGFSQHDSFLFVHVIFVFIDSNLAAFSPSCHHQ
jgi:hypothetical protein